MYKPTIGLEIHAELKTKTKMFCGCLNDPDEERPNINICPICLAHPGVLPTINHEAVRSIIKAGLAMGGTIAKISKFDRKNYFYPDLPKGYQISQYDMPLVEGGSLLGVQLTRIHLEEDTARLLHDDKGDSLVDFNRSGRALMELVTEPVVKSADEALAFAKELRLILRYIDASDADMEKGQMRVEANVSVSKTDKLGTKVELKNINSFRAVRDAVAYEIKRQIEVLDGGGKIVQETRGWDDQKLITFSQRSKEQAHDYRYMPEPDLPPIAISGEELKELQLSVPELPADKRKRFIKEYKLSDKQANLLVEDRWLSEYYEEVISEIGDKADPIIIFNYLTSDLKGLMNQKGVGIRDIKISAEDFGELSTLVVSGAISSAIAKRVLIKMFETGFDPHLVIKNENMSQISDEGELRKIILETMSSSANIVADYKKGKTNALEALIGRAMGKLKGRGNPEVLRRLFLKELG